jgi:hypothetical protein
MLCVPKAAEPLVSSFSVAFTRPTFQRVVVLILGAILTPHQRTVCAILRTLGALAPGHWSNFHRVLSLRVWAGRALAKALAAVVLELVPPDQPVICPVDDTCPQHKGKNVYGKGKHHDACRSTRTHHVWVWGHKWVVLAINVKFPFASRPWALPVLCALYRPEDLNKKEKRRHKTPIDLSRQLMALLIHWFPQRKFILVGDGGYASHALARFCHRHRRHVTLISRFPSDAALYEAPPARTGKSGRPRVRGAKLPNPQQRVAASKAKRFTVNWYGGKTRRVELISEEANWYRSGEGMIPVRWVFVQDVQGTHEDGYFYTTDATLSPRQIVSLFTGRWSIEVTFQEVRAHLGFNTPRNWTKQSVLRTAPCLLGMFSVVTLIFHRHCRDKQIKPMSFAWYAKKEITFSDAMICVRRLGWQEVFAHSAQHAGALKLPRGLRAMLLDYLSGAT